MKIRIFLPLMLLTGCTHSVHMQHVSDFDHVSAAEKRSVVTAETEQTVVLGFVFDTDYVDQAKQQLMAQCNGRLSAVTTQYSTSHSFLHWTNKIRMQGLCSEG
ncbi:MAG: hypothetical protein LRY66_05345 [Saccharospirillaceae bacterium]|nr:hypothetical protein [Saccharospirillaceae bacterium]MCD8530782.1 hypothetical protein [Saccharospirillaceae bacterium]